ncbi:hypothetical protein FB567DRAFT_35178 [Paraphoma chrysanthemicola]|uniref:Uncharacterized protein n=1 Tax=Paraphoma chrysanthemicola TaxID=798071 RepID=A0A8K0RHU7_9PLEO|nr:hypothetical protein FB567DRAFT_35178 [Paraphoma chrysanthemicola]
MAPTPTEDVENNDSNNNLVADPSPTPKPDPGYWTKSNIGLTVMFAILALAISLVLLIFYLRRRSEKKKRILNPKSDKAGLLAHEDKESMFSRHRHSSVTLYVDSDTDAQTRRVSQESISLVPLNVTPLDEVHDPFAHNARANTTTTASHGSGVSAISRLSSNTASTMMLSPISPTGDEGDLSIRPSGRARSTSSASQKARYYESTPVDVERPPIPRIVRTPSD